MQENNDFQEQRDNLLFQNVNLYKNLSIVITQRSLADVLSLTLS